MSWFPSPACSLGVNVFFLIPSSSKMGISSLLLPPGHFYNVSGATVWARQCQQRTNCVLLNGHL